jgi:hypothetical protein
MTWLEAVQSKKPFKRPHWRASMRGVWTAGLRGPKVVWQSSGDGVDGISIDTSLATDFIFSADERRLEKKKESVMKAVEELRAEGVRATLEFF